MQDIGTWTSHVALRLCNALYCGLPKSNLKQLQRVQNAAARVIMGNTQGESISMCLKELHWLQHKLLTLVYRYLIGEAPQYLQELLVEQPCYRQGLQSKYKYKRLRSLRPKGKLLQIEVFQWLDQDSGIIFQIMLREAQM